MSDDNKKLPSVNLTNPSEEWHRIQAEQPELARLINVNSFRLAPDDAETRELISTSMVLMNIMQQEIAIHKDLKQSIGDSLSQYFSLSD
jgi:hypothetical protein